MAEEVNYASVVFKAKNNPPPEAKKEEDTVYDEVKVESKKSQETADTNESDKNTKQAEENHAGFLPDKKANNRRCHQVAFFLGFLCAILLAGIIVVVSVYIATLSEESETNELNQLKVNQTAILADNRNLTNLNNRLMSDNENLRKDNKNLTVQFDNLTKAYAVLENKMTELTSQNLNLTARNQELETQNLNLTTRNQKLEKERNNLTQEIQNIQTEWNELNVTRAQWSIDAYCTKENTGRQCKACQYGWLEEKSRCYAINDPEPPGQRNWEGAREDCRGKNSDLAVVVNEQEKTYISNNIWGSIGFWIGLRAEDGRWKWVDGRNLTESSWIQQPADNGQCVISVYNQGWKSVSCSDRNRWICEKAALSV
ncbi:asialoglycoprotein receptor 1-like isoform X3 [Toxotes jaculatrix]|uniref:asialoglycoprotein receptor 1-like isoform X3 n=1 Tax=Toxotes jaculatrix TaxID=941984 RepID=UPI001B3AB497|nr:asialoglycoprotein receptor 1-like isoform X3 [Toxotes jaculatrix]